jgi:hypothetical protein
MSDNWEFQQIDTATLEIDYTVLCKRHDNVELLGATPNKELRRLVETFTKRRDGLSDRGENSAANAYDQAAYELNALIDDE